MVDLANLNLEDPGRLGKNNDLLVEEVCGVLSVFFSSSVSVFDVGCPGVDNRLGSVVAN